MSYSRNRAIVAAFLDGGMSQTEAACYFGVSTRWVRTLIRRHEACGLEGLKPRSRRPHAHPTATPLCTREAIIEWRHRLIKDGLDAGPASIWMRMDPQNQPSRTTIWRILKAEGLITPQPHKRPRSSWHRFEAHQPNECWQSDFTHWRLDDKDDVEIISWLDDHSRYLLHISAHHVTTTTTVVTTFLNAQDAYGLPRSTLTDNGLVYTARLARGAASTSYQPNAFETLLADLRIAQKNGRPSHPTTQGKIERFHQTLKLWLAAQPPARDLADLNTLLADFARIYNTQRPHRALHGRTPHQAYTATPATGPTLDDDQHWRIRYDLVHDNGTITIRYAGTLTHLGIGRAHKHHRVIAITNGPHAIVIRPDTGEIISEYTIDPTRTYQKKHTPQPERSPET